MRGTAHAPHVVIATSADGKRVSFRIRKTYFDAIVAGEKVVEVRKMSPYWVAVAGRAPRIAVFVCGSKVHRRRITGISVYPTAAEALGREPSEQGRADLGTGPVYAFHLGEIMKDSVKPPASLTQYSLERDP